MSETIDTTSGNDCQPSDWEAKQAVQDRLHADLLPRNKATLFDALAAAGITDIIVTFDGYGDSGQIENIEVKAGDALAPLPQGDIERCSAAWGRAEAVRSRVSIADAIECLAYDLLEQTHSGWENDDGAYGDFTFDVAARTITLDHNDRYTTSEYSQHVF
jgi:hypothetical protein